MAKKKYRRLNYFYLNGDLHRNLHVNRGADQVTTWCYPLHKRVVYTWSDVRKRHGKAWRTRAVAEMLGRKPLAIERALLRGDITPPQYTYGLDENKRKYQYLWSEENIIEAHAYFSTVHIGRPRKDGRVTTAGLPSLRELRARLRQEEILYVRGEDGEFRPTWKAEDFD